MDLYTILAYLTGICIIFLVFRIFILPLKYLFKLLVNSTFGIAVLYIINFIGNYAGFHIGFNVFTVIFVSLLGIPGGIVLSMVKLLI